MRHLLSASLWMLLLWRRPASAGDSLLWVRHDPDEGGPALMIWCGDVRHTVHLTPRLTCCPWEGATN